MDPSVISAILGAQARMNADSERAIVQMISAAAQSANSLANVAAGTGTNLDTTA